MQIVLPTIGLGTMCLLKCLHVLTACAVLTSDGITEALKVAEMNHHQSGRLPWAKHFVDCSIFFFSQFLAGSSKNHKDCFFFFLMGSWD